MPFFACQSCFTNIQQEAIAISSEILLGRWAEGTGTSKTVIYDNVIENVDKQNTGHGALFSTASLADSNGFNYAVHNNITIYNNVFNGTYPRALILQMLSNAVVNNNTFINPDETSDGTAIIRIRKASNVRINNNQWALATGVSEPTLGAKVLIEIGTTTSIYGNGNEILPLSDLELPATSSVSSTTTRKISTIGFKTTTRTTRSTIAIAGGLGGVAEKIPISS